MKIMYASLGARKEKQRNKYVLDKFVLEFILELDILGKQSNFISLFQRFTEYWLPRRFILRYWKLE